jgi:hypothetical protein
MPRIQRHRPAQPRSGACTRAMSRGPECPCDVGDRILCRVGPHSNWFVGQVQQITWPARIQQTGEPTTVSFKVVKVHDFEGCWAWSSISEWQYTNLPLDMEPTRCYPWPR